jgi:hypothetical protein
LSIYYGTLSFLNKYFKDRDKALLVFKNNARRGLMVLGSDGKIFLAHKEEKNVEYPNASYRHQGTGHQELGRSSICWDLSTAF